MQAGHGHPLVEAPSFAGRPVPMRREDVAAEAQVSADTEVVGRIPDVTGLPEWLLSADTALGHAVRLLIADTASGNEPVSRFNNYV